MNIEDGRPRRFIIPIIVGLVFSGILLFHHVTVTKNLTTGPSSCVIGTAFNCDNVARSPFAELFGIPVASIGALYYLFLLLLVCVPSYHPDQRSRLAGLWVFMTGLALVVSLGLFAVSWFIIKSICLYCSVLYVVNLVLFVIAALDYRRNDPGNFIAAAFSLLGAYLRRFFQLGSDAGLHARMSAAIMLFAAGALYLTPAFIVQAMTPERPAAAADPAVLPKELQDIFSTWKPIQALPFQSETEFFRGPADAPIVLYDFSDFACPFCKRAAFALEELSKRFPTTLKVVYKHFPLDITCNWNLRNQVHENSCLAAKSATCAGLRSPGQFWKMHDGLFGLGGLSTSGIESLWEELGADPVEFRSCVEGQDAGRLIMADIDLGRRLEVHGTPSMFIVVGDRYLEVRPQSLERLPEVIEKLLVCDNVMHQTSVQLP